MKIVTWNINSIRLRLSLLQRLIDIQSPDIICVQETKVQDCDFPLEAIQKMGYSYVHFHGMKSYNGQAILSKIPFESTDIHHRVGRQDCRHISAKISVDNEIAQAFEIHNLYIPAGGDLPDRDINEKFAHKLDFVDEMTEWFKNTYTKDTPLIAIGDFNIAPEEHDVWSHKQLLKVVSHTPQETERLVKMQESLDWIDVSRHFVPSHEKCYSWWSYRNRNWKKSNRGRRLDHIWVTSPLKSTLKTHHIMSEARDWEKPSDHVPIIIDLKQ